MKIFWCLVLVCGVACGQAPSDSQQQVQPPKGQVLFQSHGSAPEPAVEGETAPVIAADGAKPSGPELTDVERGALRFVAYDLDARLTPAVGKLVMRARVTLRNDGSVPLHRVALQISSTLRWESATLLAASGPKVLTLSQHLLDTDADHTGKANEAVIALPEELAPGGTVQLDTFYEGTIAASGARLQRLGASEAQAADSDWDVIAANGTALRGFGNVLWYPVASPQLFLGDGAKLFEAVGAAKLHDEAVSVRLRVSVEYNGDPPVAAYFCGRRKTFTALADNSDEPIAVGSGLATAEFDAEPLGFRVPSLFVVNVPERLVAPLPVLNEVDAMGSADAVGEQKSTPPATTEPSISTGTGISSSNAVANTVANSSMLAVESDDDGAVSSLVTSAENVTPVLQSWLGAEPLSALTVIDHRGQPFEDGPLLVGPAAALGTSDASGALAHSLTHAWVQTGRPWMDEGLAEFFSLLWTEHEAGREKAIAQLDDLLQPLALAEPAIEPAGAKESGAGNELVGQVVGQPLIAASSELYYRRKAAAVWWMLRGIVGDDALGEALSVWRQRTPGNTTAEEDALAFEALLEKSGKENAKHPINLHWFFNDWVLHDRGLPDLSIVDVAPRELPMGAGHTAGYLVAVTVKNDGAAEAQVPVTIRSATFSTTSQLRIVGFGSATARVIVETLPTEVLVNDGVTPEVRTSFHKVSVAAVKREQ